MSVDVRYALGGSSGLGTPLAFSGGGPSAGADLWVDPEPTGLPSYLDYQPAAIGATFGQLRLLDSRVLRFHVALTYQTDDPTASLTFGMDYVPGAPVVGLPVTSGWEFAQWDFTMDATAPISGTPPPYGTLFFAELHTAGTSLQVDVMTATISTVWPQTLATGPAVNGVIFE